MIVYYQAKFTDSNSGKTIYQGEDTYPYATSDLLIISDGLGGRGSWRHVDVNQNILKKDGFYDLVFAPVFEKETSPEFKEYTLKCFQEVFMTKDYYFDIPDAVKPSGYFASRLISAIVAYEFEYDTDIFDRTKIFTAVDKLELAKKEGKSKEVAEASATLQEYGDRLTEILTKKLETIAANLNLTLGTQLSGTIRPYLLPATLQTALIREKKDCVQALYFWAGDSRAYAWDEKDGVAVLTPDHEQDEIMTNLVSLSEKYRIETRAFTFNKPCILFNTSDGFYKGKNMSSFGMEYVLLNAFIKGKDYEEASNHWVSFFDANTKHDDSNTMALWAYGYKNYDAVKNAAKARMKTFKKEVLDPLPDIIEGDYVHQLKNYQSEIDDAISTTGRPWLKLPCAIEIAKKLLIKNGYKPYKDELARREPEIRAPFEAEKNKEGEEIKQRYKTAFEQLDIREKEAGSFDRTTTIISRMESQFMDLLRALAYNNYVLCHEFIEGRMRNSLDASSELQEKSSFAQKTESELWIEIDNTKNAIDQQLNGRPLTESPNRFFYYFNKKYQNLLDERNYLIALKKDLEKIKKFFEDNCATINEIEDVKTKYYSLEAIEAERNGLRTEIQSHLNVIEDNFNNFLKSNKEYQIALAKLKEEIATQLAPRYCRFMPKIIMEEIWEKRKELLDKKDYAEAEAAVAAVDQKYAAYEDKLRLFQIIEENYQKTYMRLYQKSLLFHND